MAIISMPRERAMRYDDSDISEISNSSKLSCRQNVSDGSERVGISSTPSGWTAPSTRGATRSLVPVTKLRVNRAMG